MSLYQVYIFILLEHYEFNEEIEFKGLSHKLPFGKFKVFEKYLFTISHYLWSKKATKNFDFEQNSKIQSTRRQYGHTAQHRQDDKSTSTALR